MEPITGPILFPSGSSQTSGGSTSNGTTEPSDGQTRNTSDTTTVSGAGQSGDSNSTNDTDAGAGQGAQSEVVTGTARFSEPATPFVDLRDIPRLSLPDPGEEQALALARATALAVQSRAAQQSIVDTLAAGIEAPQPLAEPASEEGFAIAQRYGAEPQTGDLDLTS